MCFTYRVNAKTLLKLLYSYTQILIAFGRKENTVLRAKVPANHVSVIPNATDTTLFKPNVTKKETDQSI